MGDMMGTKEASRKWGYPQTEIWEWCRAGMIEGAVHGKPGSSWRMPKDARCPRLIRSVQTETDALPPEETEENND